MSKLKIKVFLAIFILLSIHNLVVISLTNYQEYNREKRKVDSLLSNTLIDAVNNNDTNYKFIELDIYSVKLNENNEVLNIQSHTQNGTIPDAINELIDSIKKENLKESNINLYFDDYSYKYENGKSISIIDNSLSRKRLLHNLNNRIISLMLAEIGAFMVGYLLSIWITKPAEESFKKQKEFIADASHELKTPLSVIIASAESMDVNNDDKSLINNIKTESEKMSRLVTNLLDLSKIESSGVVEENTNLSKLIEKESLTLESIIFEKKLKLKYDIEKNIQFKCNQEEIKQLITILVDNAIHHSIKNSTITIKLYKKDYIIFEIINKGEAISKEDEERIFERFYRADKSRNREDNRYGLGLAIAKSIVEKHKGIISAFSEDGFTTFKVIFKK